MNHWALLGWASLLLLLAAPGGAAQSVPAFRLPERALLEEDFDNGIPASWSNLQFGYTGDQWLPGFQRVDGSPDVFHEAFCDAGFFFRDNILLSPALDLSGLTNVSFSCEQYQRFALSRLSNKVVVTTDGGASYTTVYDETGTSEGFGKIVLDLSAYAGKPSVQIGFHYQGTVANEWSIDNVRVTTTNPLYEVTNLVAGSTTTLSVTGCQAGSGVYIAVSLTGPGPINTPYGDFNVSPPFVFLPVLTADQRGEVAVDLPVPPSATGITVYTHAAELLPGVTVRLSNSIIETIQ